MISQKNHIDQKNRDSDICNGKNLPARNRASGEEIKLATGLVLRLGEDLHLLSWEHLSPSGQRSNVQFNVVPNRDVSLDIQIESMVALFRRDHVRERAGNPLISAFFRGLLCRADVGLARIANCSATRVMFSSLNSSATLSLENVELHSCAIALGAKELNLDRVTFEGDSSLTIDAKSSSFKNVKIGRNCHIAGDLGNAIIAADCTIQGYAKYLNMLNAKWLEVPGAPSVRQRTRGIVVGKSLRSEEFARQAGLVSMTAHDEAALMESLERQLDKNWR